MFVHGFALAKMVRIVENLFEEGNWAILEWRDPLGLRGCGFFKIENDQITLQRGYWAPGVVITASPDPEKIFVGSPTIAILPDGSYLVTHDNGGPGAGALRGNASILSSRDKGATWTKLAEVTDQKWSTLVVQDRKSVV